MPDFVRTMRITPAYDLRHHDPKKNCGIHGCDLQFFLKGPKGVVQFIVYTNWQLPGVQKEMLEKPIKESFEIEIRFLPMPADLGYHSPVPMYEDQPVCRKECEHLDGKPCYYDGSGCNAMRVFTILTEKGSEGVWAELEDYYNRTFGDKQCT